MNKFLVAATAVVLVFLSNQVPAQDLRRVYTRPQIPPPEVLQRLRLREAWHAFLPMDGQRDGIFTLQLAPLGKGFQILAQTRSGLVVALNAETGETQWTSRLGVPYRPAQPVAFNNRSVFVINNIELFALDRTTGQLQWQTTLPQGAASPPVADDEQLYLSLTTLGLTTFRLPFLGSPEKNATKPGSPSGQGQRSGTVTGLEPSPSSIYEADRTFRKVGTGAVGPLVKAREAGLQVKTGPQPLLAFSLPPISNLELPALATVDRLLLLETNGIIVGISRTSPQEVYRIPTKGAIWVSPGQHDEIAYVASNEFTLFAVHIPSGRVFWRFFTPGPVTQRPMVLDDSVFVSQARAGLSSVNRKTGEEIWNNTRANRFLAASKDFVYAFDHSGRLLVLDRFRGTTLSNYEGTRDFVVPFPNEWTDRLYLAANNGLVVCLHDRDNTVPVIVKSQPAPQAAPSSSKPK
jgi:outer membrane protein assembly factor BamB